MKHDTTLIAQPADVTAAVSVIVTLQCDYKLHVTHTGERTIERRARVARVIIYTDFTAAFCGGIRIIVKSRNVHRERLTSGLIRCWKNM